MLTSHTTFCLWSKDRYITVLPGIRFLLDLIIDIIIFESIWYDIIFVKSLTTWLEQTVHMSEHPGSSKVVTTCGLILLCRTHSAPFLPWPEHVTSSSSGSPPRAENSSCVLICCNCLVYKIGLGRTLSNR